MDEEKRNKALQAIAKDPYRLIKTNPIINARFDVTAIQMKVFLKVIATIDQSVNDTPIIRISVKEFQNFIGSKAKNLYKYLGTELEKLGDKKIRYEDDRSKLDANFFSSIEYFKKEGFFEFEFSQKIKPFLLQIKENFTVLDIRNLLYLDSIYAIRFYEFCKEFERFKTFEFTVEELKETFEISGRYKNYFDFKLKVLIQARNELMENSELYFDFEEIKQGRKIVRLKFTIIKNSNRLQRKTDNENEEAQVQIKEIYNTVKDYINEETVISWFSKYPYEQIKAGVRYTINEHKQGKVKDVSRYLQKMVATQNLKDPIEEKKVEQAKKIQQIQQEQLRKKQELEIEQEQNIFKIKYFDRKKQLAIQLLQSNKTLFSQLMDTLRKENQIEKPDILSELALSNYKLHTQVETASIEEFLINFNEGGIFQSYIFKKLSSQFIEFEELKNEFRPQAAKVGVKETDLF